MIIKKRPKATAQGERTGQATPAPAPALFVLLSERQDHEKRATEPRNKARQEKHQAKPQTSHTGQITSPQGRKRGTQ